MAQMKIYGIVTRYPKEGETGWTTQASGGVGSLEGVYQYEFNDDNVWRQYIYTQEDLLWFENHKDYHVERADARPVRPRPVKPEVLSPSETGINPSEAVERKKPGPKPKSAENV